jgi:tRNA G10  N-methylase Trm11
MDYQDKTIFILGSNPALSLAELMAVLGEAGWQVQSGLAIYDQRISEPEKLIRRLGGTVKIAGLKAVLDIKSKNNIQAAIENILTPGEGKFKFGISNYAGFKLNTKALGMELKKYLKAKGASVRWVTSQEPQLSSVVVEQNGLLKNGAEIIITAFDNRILIARTEAVQPFKELSFRDYGRPGRDDESGMLPPKLAQILINLAALNDRDSLLDPFCGSGTIVTEAMLMGFKKILASDLSAKAVSDTRQNIDWLQRKHQGLPEPEVRELSATRLATEFKNNSIDAIATEPYLGPQRGRIEINKVLKELNALYSATLAEFTKILKPGARLAMVWPVFKGFDNKLNHHLDPDLHGLKIIKPLPEQYAHKFNTHLSERGHLLYGRPGQKVWREIVLLQKF